MLAPTERSCILKQTCLRIFYFLVDSSAKGLRDFCYFEMFKLLLMLIMSLENVKHDTIPSDTWRQRASEATSLLITTDNMLYMIHLFDKSSRLIILTIQHSKELSMLAL